MNTTDLISRLPRKALARVERGELHIHRVGEVQCITVPLREYVELLEDRVTLKQRRKK